MGMPVSHFFLRTSRTGNDLRTEDLLFPRSVRMVHTPRGADRRHRGGINLRTGGRRSEAVVTAAAELTVVFGTLVLITGPLWARIAWGHYWVWDVRLTTLLVLFLIFMGVLIARRYAGPGRRKITSALALFGAVDVPFIYVSVSFWKTVHPKTSVVPGLTGKMRIAFWVSMFTITLLFSLFLWVRYRLERSQQALEDLDVQLQHYALSRA